MAHSIQGAADGFGFVKFGELIMQLELDIINEKHGKVAQYLSHAQQDLTYFNNIPNVVLPIGLCNFNQNKEKWHDRH